MKNKSNHKIQILAIPLSIASIVLVLLCFFLLQIIDVFVQNDLYGYGLVFSYEWANQYVNFSSLIKDYFFITAILSIGLIVLIILHFYSKRKILRIMSSILLLINTFFLSFSLFSLTRLDFIVQNTLYSYGLQFSYDWSGLYWGYIITSFGLFISAILIQIMSFLLLVAPGSWFSLKVKSIFKLNSLILIIGILILFSSVTFNSSILTFIGLGCIFWGAILFYVRSGTYVKQELLLASIRPTLGSLRELLLELGYQGNPVYLPPKYLIDFESSKVFISKTSKFVVPSDEQLQDKDKVIIKNPQGVIITPPGFELSKFFEETIDQNFIQKDLSFIQKNIQKLIVDDLEIAENIQMEQTDTIIRVIIGNSVYKNLGTLSSALACIFAKASGKLVIIKNRLSSANNQIIELEYDLIDPPID